MQQQNVFLCKQTFCLTTNPFMNGAQQIIHKNFPLSEITGDVFCDRKELFSEQFIVCSNFMWLRLSFSVDASEGKQRPFLISRLLFIQDGNGLLIVKQNSLVCRCQQILFYLSGTFVFRITLFNDPFFGVPVWKFSGIRATALVGLPFSTDQTSSSARTGNK